MHLCLCLSVRVCLCPVCICFLLDVSVFFCCVFVFNGECFFLCVWFALACVRVCVRAGVRVCVRVCVRPHACVECTKCKVNVEKDCIGTGAEQSKSDFVSQ